MQSRPTAKQAPEAWETSNDAVPEGFCQVTISGPDGKRIATVFNQEHVASIAAVPVLLEALEKIAGGNVMSQKTTSWTHKETILEYQKIASNALNLVKQSV